MITSKSQIEEYQLIINKVSQEIKKVIVGQGDVIDQLLFAVLAGGHALLEGVPGLGKTLLVRTLAQTLELPFTRIQFTPDLMPADIIGTNILQVENERKGFEFQKGPIFSNVILADEINRATPKTQSALLEAMQEHTVSVAGSTYKLNEPFFVIATQNPIEQEGTYPLPEAQMDRFILKINVPFPTAEELREIVVKTTSKSIVNVEHVANGATILEIQQAISEILVADQVFNYAVKILLATHPSTDNSIESINRYVRTGAGPRGIQALINVAKVRAFMQGRYNVSFEDIEYIAYPALRHRILLNFEGEANGIKTDQLIQDILKKLENEK